MAFLNRTFTTECMGEFLAALNADPTIPNCLQIVSHGGVTADFEFVTAPTAGEEALFDTFLAEWSCDGDTGPVTIPSEIEDDLPPSEDVIWSAEKINDLIDTVTAFGIYAYARVSTDGTMLASNGLTVSKVATGTYDYTFAQPYADDTYALHCEPYFTSTDTNPHISNVTSTGFRVRLGRGDNGTSADTAVNTDHSITVTGVNGPTGLGSSYHSWLLSGNAGTESDFVDALVGPQGTMGLQGTQGPQGSQGIQGPIGATGPQGDQGIQGNTGATGPTGAAGATGDTGAIGITGAMGPAGPTGATGSDGPQGNTGAQGDTGAQGPAGPQGTQGIQGDAGQSFDIETIYNTEAELLAGSVTANKFALVAGTLPTTDPDYGKLYLYNGSSWSYITDMSVEGAAGVQGPQGVIGPVGPTGLQGDTGDQGIQGPVGPVGATGIQGPVGQDGNDGNDGAQGIKGDTGAQGPIGATGTIGNTGPQGEGGPQGAQGIQGIQGDTGSVGAQGIKGDTGDAGPNGLQGDQGIQGNTGPQGDTGAAGAQGVAGQGFDIETIFNSDADLLAGTVTEGRFGLVAGTLDTSDPDYGRLYLYVNSSWTYITDMSVAGADGVQGPQGEQGIQGNTGPQGDTGAPGAQGETGDAGAQGPTGATGPTGSQGIQGIKGDNGDTGAVGADGPQGETGLQGPAGVQGIQGIVGPEGPQGEQGPAYVGSGITHQLTFLENKDACNEWLELYGNNNKSNQSMGVMPFKSKLIGISMTNSNQWGSGDIQLYSTAYNSGYSPKTLDLNWEMRYYRTAWKTNFATDIIFEAGDKVAIYVDQYDHHYKLKNVTVQLYFEVIDATTSEGNESYSGNCATSSGGGSHSH